MISICVATYNRPDGLKKLLEGLNQLTFTRIEPPSIEIVIADNEACGKAKEVCQVFQDRFKWQIVCHEEPRKGITYARNKCLENIQPATDFVVFVDDDEVPAPDWLESLLLTQREYEADIVTGPVTYLFESPLVPQWIIDGNFFRRPNLPDGHPVKMAFTNNVLVSVRVFKEMGRLFDHAFALTGGEDTDFFMSADKAGYKMVWSDRAVVYETVPESRTTVSWLLKRGYREWNSHSRCEKTLYPSLKVRVERVVKAATLIMLGSFSLPVTIFLGKHRRVRSLLLIYRGMGSFSGLLGKHYREYA